MPALSVLALAASIFWLGAAAAGTAPRLALVIGGNGQIARSTSVADAGLVAEALSQDGFEVTALEDVDAATLRKTVAGFADKLRRAGGETIVFVYLSGVGAQWDGGNVIVPAAARVERQVDLPGNSVPLDEIARPIEALPARARIFAYDIARDGQVAKADALPLAPGLALVHPPKGALYAFNAAPGMIAAPDAPPYGCYARALAEMLRTPGLSARAMFARVRLRVAQMSGGAAVPWDADDLDGEPIVLAAGAAARPPAAERPIDGLPVEDVFWAAIAEDTLTGYDAFLHSFPDDRLAGRVKATIETRLEAMTWAAAVEANVPPAYWTYMLRYPRGAHYVDVRRRLAAIHAPLAPPPRFDVFDFAGLPSPKGEAPKTEAAPGVDSASRRDADWAPVPAVPSDFITPPPAAFYEALPPPPLAPEGALPIPPPLPALAALAAAVPQGRIEQPFAPHGAVAAEPGTGTTLMTLATAAGVLSRTTVEDDPAGHAILQRDAANRIQSRTLTTQDGGRLTILQTGPTGGILAKLVTTTGADGDRTTRVTNGANQLVAEVQADSRGVETGIVLGTATMEGPPLSAVPAPIPAPPAKPPPQPDTNAKPESPLKLRP